jgi:hypothetical protein
MTDVTRRLDAAAVVRRQQEGSHSPRWLAPIFLKRRGR